jgi:Ca2+-binding EF-hand superfamily protein
MKSLLATLLLFAMTRVLAAAEPPSPDAYKILYFANSRVTVMQINVIIDGQSPNQHFETCVDALLKSLDKNSDGVVTVEESRGKLISAQEAKRILAIDGDAVDASPDFNPKDGKISRSELLAYFKRIGILPFHVTLQSRTAAVDPNSGAVIPQAQSGQAALFERLDANRDQKLSVEELGNAWAVLRKLDLDGDETISAVELQPLASQTRPANPAMNNAATPGIPFASVSSGESLPKIIRRLVDKYDSTDPTKSGTGTASPRNQKLSPMELGITQAECAKFDVDGDGQLDFVELRQYVISADPTYGVSLNLTEGRADVTGNKDDVVHNSVDGDAHLQIDSVQISVTAIPGEHAFDAMSAIQPLFMRLDEDSNGYLERAEASNLLTFGATFPDLDTDQNGKLVLEEVASYLMPRMEIAQNRVELSIIEQGRTLFDILDVDRDGRLAHREVRSVADKLALWDSDHDGQLSEKEIPLQFWIVASRAMLPNLGIRVDPAGPSPRFRPQAQAGPIWFRKMDRNGDGEISRREFLGELDLFDQLDLNHDAAIELQEALRATPQK